MKNTTTSNTEILARHIYSNRMWERGEIPKTWKHATITPLLTYSAKYLKRWQTRDWFGTWKRRRKQITDSLALGNKEAQQTQYQEKGENSQNLF